MRASSSQAAADWVSCLRRAVAKAQEPLLGGAKTEAAFASALDDEAAAADDQDEFEPELQTERSVSPRRSLSPKRISLVQITQKVGSINRQLLEDEQSPRGTKTSMRSDDSPSPSVPWPTAKTNCDRRPSHKRHSYAPELSRLSRSLTASRVLEGDVVSERLYRQGVARQRDAAARTPTLDTGQFDYESRAGISPAHRTDWMSHKKSTQAKRNTKEEFELSNATFTPDLSAKSCGPARDASAPIWDRLHDLADQNKQSRVRKQLAKEEQDLENLTLTPELSKRAEVMMRDGLVEDRLHADWMQTLEWRKEQAMRQEDDEAARIREKAASMKMPSAVAPPPQQGRAFDRLHGLHAARDEVRKEKIKEMEFTTLEATSRVWGAGARHSSAHHLCALPVDPWS